MLCEFNVAYLENENNIGCLRGLSPKGSLDICQKEGNRKYIRETFTKPNLKKKALQGLKICMRTHFINLHDLGSLKIPNTDGGRCLRR